MTTRFLLLPVVLLGVAGLGCDQGQKPTQDPLLQLSVKPAEVPDRNGDTDVMALAQDAFARPGKGDVALQVAHGKFGNGQNTITLTLDSAGVAWTTYSCSVFEDGDCFGPMDITGTWNDTVSKTSLDTKATVTVVGCGLPDAGAPTIHRVCAPPTDNECAGGTDTFLTGAGVGPWPDGGSRLNLSGGNGFDDDCDGLVDEGCACPGNGETRDCYLVPATQTDPASGLPVNWCATNARGSNDCATSGGASPTWTGQCRGARSPQVHDSCNPGDFNCDGIESNNDLEGCRCAGTVECPADALQLKPYPDPGNLAPINGGLWIGDPTMRALARNWTWTLVGGDCDNILPHPTFALYNNPNTGTAGAGIGVRTPVLYQPALDPPRYVAVADSGVAAIRALTQSSIIYPAFGLSGDYVVQGEWDLQGHHYTCSQKVQVRAPGVRAELCWDTVGHNDIDLHLARLQGATCGGNHGWWNTCTDAAREDCYFANTLPNWGYVVSPDSACHGWGSKSSGACNNPRLDRDNISCDPTQADPIGAGFCSPENINVDDPHDSDRFTVGVHFYGGADVTRPHVNVYCNGARVLSAGFNPVTGQVRAPLIRAPDDWWTVATVLAHVGADGGTTDCVVETVPSHSADPNRDGPPSVGTGSDFCVESRNNTSPSPHSYASQQFVEASSPQTDQPGSIPSSRQNWCKH